jgi:hypothetical protein
LLDVYIIYTLEAHPEIDTSVYFGYVETGSANIQAGILYQQPRTYGQRKTIVNEMLDSMPCLALVYLDGPCNNWWSTYGPAPNNSYLMDTNGVIFSKPGWFDPYPDDIYCDIDSLLGMQSGNCNPLIGNTNYTFQYLSSDTVYGDAGTTISVDAEITNPGTSDILVYAGKLINNMPPGWASSLCIDVCYSTSTDSIVFSLPARTTQPVHVYFYFSPTTVDRGYVRIEFRNLTDPNNQNVMHAFAITIASTAGLDKTRISPKVYVFPNPVNSHLQVFIADKPPASVSIYNLQGQLILSLKETALIDVSRIEPGIYFLDADKQKVKFIKQ